MRGWVDLHSELGVRQLLRDVDGRDCDLNAVHVDDAGIGRHEDVCEWTKLLQLVGTRGEAGGAVDVVGRCDDDNLRVVADSLADLLQHLLEVLVELHRDVEDQLRLDGEESAGEDQHVRLVVLTVQHHLLERLEQQIVGGGERRGRDHQLNRFRQFHRGWQRTILQNPLGEQFGDVENLSAGVVAADDANLAGENLHRRLQPREVQLDDARLVLVEADEDA